MYHSLSEIQCHKWEKQECVKAVLERADQVFF